MSRRMDREDLACLGLRPECLLEGGETNLLLRTGLIAGEDRQTGVL